MNDTKIKSLSLQEYPIKEILVSNGLPIDDLKTAPIQFFGIVGNDTLKGIGALEIYGHVAILRSLTVPREFQGLGSGKALVSTLEKITKNLGIKQLYLLTTTAPHFFEKLGYTQASRYQCPKEIVSSGEFTSLCPDSALCYSKEV